MKVSGERAFDAPVELVWEVLNDPARMARTMPGVESFDVQDEHRWQANVNIPLGLGALQMKINFEKTDESAPEFAKLRAKGTGVGAIMSMETQFHLSGDGNETRMQWEADVSIAGPVGSMGQRVLQPIVSQQVSSVLEGLDRQVREAGTCGDAPGGAEEGIHPAGPEADPPGPDGPTPSTR